MRPFVEHAVENVLDAHSVIERELGPLRVLRVDPSIVAAGGGELWVWGLLYETAGGTREIRRIRVGSAHDVSDEHDFRWTATAARVAAAVTPGAPCTRVRVVEIGCHDGSVSVAFDGTPTEAVDAFAGPVRDRALELLDQDHLVPGQECSACKTAGSCPALIPLDGLLGQQGHRLGSRSVSPTALAQYGTCPGQWLLDANAHLPKDRTGSEAADRGRAIHTWLKTAHRRGTGCTTTDLPAPGSHLGLADGILDDREYQLAHPYLLHHVDKCPLSEPGVSVIAVENDVHGYDHDAEVVPVTRPDLVFRRSDTLVVRDFKSREQGFAAGRDEAFDRHLQVPFALRMLDAGLLNAHGCTTGVVELELLTPEGQTVWAWRTDEPMIMAVAASEVERIADDWHEDGSWDTATGRHCRWCPVRQWCPDRDAWQAETPGPTGPSGPSDPPPF